MTAPIPTARQLASHADADHKYRARRRTDGRIICLTCNRQPGEPRPYVRSLAPNVRWSEGRTPATPAGFVTHAGGTMRTQALAPGVGITLGQLAAFVAMARDMAGLPDSARIDVVPEAKRRGRPGQRIRAMVISPATGAEEAEDAA